MPTFGYPDTSEKFQDNLDLLEVIIQKYYESHQIILAGDMNATLVKSRKTTRINVFVTLFRETNLLRPPQWEIHQHTNMELDHHK